MKNIIKYISHYQCGTEHVNIEINGKPRFNAEKVETFTPHWKLSTLSGLNFGTVSTLSDLTDAINSGTIDLEICKAEYRNKIK